MIFRSVILFSLSLLIAGCVNNNAEQFPVPSKAKRLSEADRKYFSYKACQNTSECIVVSNACMFPEAINRERKSEFFVRVQERQPYVYCEYKPFDYSRLSAVCSVGVCEVVEKNKAEINLDMPNPHKP